MIKEKKYFILYVLLGVYMVFTYAYVYTSLDMVIFKVLIGVYFIFKCIDLFLRYKGFLKSRNIKYYLNSLDIEKLKDFAFDDYTCKITLLEEIFNNNFESKIVSRIIKICDCKFEKRKVVRGFEGLDMFIAFFLYIICSDGIAAIFLMPTIIDGVIRWFMFRKENDLLLKVSNKLCN